jgi:hypothetical protein
VQHVAQTVEQKLNERLARDSIGAIGYFNKEAQEFIHISRDLQQQYDEPVFDDILENAFVEVWGDVNQDRVRASELHATTRIYDTYVDMVIPLTKTDGVVFLIDRDAEYQYPKLIEEVKDAITPYDSDTGLS